jgi:hypothetical protein
MCDVVRSVRGRGSMILPIDLTRTGADGEPVSPVCMCPCLCVCAFGSHQDDPYVQNGLVTQWVVREWTVVAGTALDALK